MVHSMQMETLARQRAYVAQKKSEGNGIGLVFADAFIRGMRDIGYKSNGWALAEMIDNSVQAGASTIGVQFGFANAGKSTAKPDKLAVIDNGVGIDKGMLSYAVRWGGTDRENSRDGFGRYGYGLPSSAVSICQKYTVYSKTPDDGWHAVTVDIQELAKVASDIKTTEKMLEPKEASPPSWLTKKLCGIETSTIDSGTIVVLEDMDRLQFKKTATLQAKLLQLFGVVYRHWIPTPKIMVHGTAAEPVDPLFLMEGGRFFDETEVRAERVETRTFEVETTRGTKGTVRIRASVLPPDFQNKEVGKVGQGFAKNGRFSVMKEYNGLQICRDGRQIDCIAPRHTKFQNADINTKIEIDFDPELDEFFGITTSKQQIVIDEVMWDKIEQGGRLRDLVKDIRERVKQRYDQLKAKMESGDDPEVPRSSEVAMMETEKFKAKPDVVSDRQKQSAKKNLEDTATRVSEKTGKSKQDVVEELQERAKARRFEVEFQSIPEGPFYRPYRLGEQKRVIINTQHPFYTKVYSVAPDVASALEVLLMVIAEAELEAEGDAEIFYQTSRSRWSERLRYALDRLSPDDEMRDKASAIAEEMHMSALSDGTGEV